MIKKYRNISLYYSITGLLLLMPFQKYLVLRYLIATILFIIGGGYLARAKGRIFSWCWLGIFNIFGIVTIARLKDLTSTPEELAELKKKQNLKYQIKTTKPRDVILGIILGLLAVIIFFLIVFFATGGSKQFAEF